VAAQRFSDIVDPRPSSRGLIVGPRSRDDRHHSGRKRRNRSSGKIKPGTPNRRLETARCQEGGVPLPSMTEARLASAQAAFNSRAAPTAAHGLVSHR